MADLALHIALVSDGSPNQLTGIAVTMTAIRDSLAHHSSNAHFWVALPTDRTSLASPYLKLAAGTVPMRLISAKSSEADPYYVQLSLADVFQQVPDEEWIIALDYDHVLFRPDAFDPWSRVPEPCVSSESYPGPADAYGHDCHIASVDNALPHRHLNASLIKGNAGDLKKAGIAWRDTYEALTPLVPVRNRAELAFSKAVESATLDIPPCSTEIQASFAMPDARCMLFHYGGDSAEAVQVKQRLFRLSQEYPMYQHSLDYFREMHGILRDTCEGLVMKSHSAAGR